jgi:hypothetical protein
MASSLGTHCGGVVVVVDVELVVVPVWPPVPVVPLLVQPFSGQPSQVSVAGLMHPITLPPSAPARRAPIPISQSLRRIFDLL